METKVLVFNQNGKWVLRILVYDEDKKTVTEIAKDKLIEVIDIACLLKLHINNEETLPVNQYLKQPA